MVVIRLSRGGAKKRPFYSVVVADRRAARDGRCIERVGYFNPIASGKDVKLLLNQERIKYWLSLGAQASERVKKLMKNFEEEAAKATA
jgi:small subunit ribosomal protein S16